MGKFDPHKGKWIRIYAVLVGIALGLSTWAALNNTLHTPTWARDTATTYRIYILGGSTSKGSPYKDHLDVGRIAAYMLGDDVARRSIEVINLAESGNDAAYALGQVEEVVEIERDLSSSLVFVYTGNNEFLRFNRNHDLSQLDRPLVDEPLVDAAKYEEVLFGFGSTVEELLRNLRQADIPVVLSTVAVNLSDWEPNRSTIADPENEGLVLERMENAESAMLRGEERAALAYLEAVLDVEPHFAWAWKRSRDALSALERFEEALDAYGMAVDWDANPSRATSRQNALLRELSAELDVPLIDTERVFRAASLSGSPGFDLFWDWCHPTLEGHMLIAIELARFVAIELDHTLDRPDPTPVEIAEVFGIDERAMTRILHRQARLCYGHATLIWNPAARLARSRYYLEQALAGSPESPEIQCSLGVLSAMERDMESCIQHFRKARAISPQVASRRLKRPQLRELLSGLGVEDASALLD